MTLSARIRALASVPDPDEVRAIAERVEGMEKALQAIRLISAECIDEQAEPGGPRVAVVNAHDVYDYATRALAATKEPDRG